MITLGIVLGLLASTGLATGLVATIPAGRLELAAALHHATHTAPGPATGSGGAVVARLTAYARRGQHPWFALPETNLNLLELAPEQYLTRRLRAAQGLAAGAVLGVLGLVADLHPAAVAVLCALAGTPAGGMLPRFLFRISKTATATADAC